MLKERQLLKTISPFEANAIGINGVWIAAKSLEWTGYDSLAEYDDKHNRASYQAIADTSARDVGNPQVTETIVGGKIDFADTQDKNLMDAVTHARIERGGTRGIAGGFRDQRWDWKVPRCECVSISLSRATMLAIFFFA